MENAEVQEYVQGEVTLAEELVVQSSNLVIENKEAAGKAADWLKEVKTRAKELEAKRTSITKPINDSLKEINKLFKEPAGLLQEIEGNIKRAMLVYTRAEQARIRAEQEAARKKAEAAQKKKEAWAAKAEQRGDSARAEELREQAEEIVPDTVVASAHKPEGIYTQKRWKAEVTDKADLLAAVMSGDVSMDVVVIDMSYLDGLAKRLHGSYKVPGVRFYEEETVAARL